MRGLPGRRRPEKVLHARAPTGEEPLFLAPFAVEAGGLQRCSQPVFRSTDDPDYQKILHTFDPIHALLKSCPRADMANFESAVD